MDLFLSFLFLVEVLKWANLSSGDKVSGVFAGNISSFKLNFSLKWITPSLKYLSDISLSKPIDFIVNKTVALPIGFLIGSSFTLGLISGGLTSVLMINDKN